MIANHSITGDGVCGDGKGVPGARRSGVVRCAGAPIPAFTVLPSPEVGTAKASLGLIGPCDARSLDRDNANDECRMIFRYTAISLMSSVNSVQGKANCAL